MQCYLIVDVIHLATGLLWIFPWSPSNNLTSVSLHVQAFISGGGDTDIYMVMARTDKQIGKARPVLKYNLELHARKLKVECQPE